MNELYNLKSFFVKKNIKQKDVAKLLGLTESMFSLKINGKSEFKFSELKLMQHHFNFSFDEIFL